MAKGTLWGVWKVNGRKAHKAEKWSLDKTKCYNRSYARSRDCHTTDAHRAISVWKLSNGTSGGASNLLAHEDLELI